jgi:oligopeptide/dipeptide ABC transporter ATP-binding protein
MRGESNQPGVGHSSFLELRDLTVDFPLRSGQKRRVVHGVSIKLSGGERVALVGQSGSGKSISALAMLGMVPPPGEISGGSVLLGQLDLLSASEKDLGRIRGRVVGFVFQEAGAALNPVYSVGYQLDETARHHRGLSRAEARNRGIASLSDLGFSDPESIRAAYPHQLSGGQAQRVMIAAALAGDPQFLIADEPTTALDTTTQAQVLDLVDKLVDERGLGLLFVSHDLSLVRGAVDRVYVMYAGEIVESGKTGQVFDDPAHPYTRLLVAVAKGKKTTATLESVAQTTGCRFAPRCEYATKSCGSEHPSLHQVGNGRECRCAVISESS